MALVILIVILPLLQIGKIILFTAVNSRYDPTRTSFNFWVPRP